MSKSTLILWLVAVVLVVLAFVLPALPQPLTFHDFADQRACGIANFADVASNIAFLLVGLCGLRIALRLPADMKANTRVAYTATFAALALTAFGSAWFHLHPNNATLVWDRLPMALVFMSLLAATLAERTTLRAHWPLPVLCTIGVGTVLYWAVTDNLVPYLLAQAGTIGMILLMTLLLPTAFTGRWLLYVAAVSYGMAFLCERFDKAIFTVLDGVISGHTIKHVLAALAFVWIGLMLHRQRLLRIGT